MARSYRFHLECCCRHILHRQSTKRPMPEKHEIFISFIHEERWVAEAVKNLIEKSYKGYGVFMANEWEIFAGEDWFQRIRESLDAASIIILMLSKQSVTRPWVNFEAGAAWFTNKHVIPVCYGGISKSTLPKPYGNLQALDLRSDIHYLLRSVSRYLPMPTISPPPVFDQASDPDYKTVLGALDQLELDMQ